MAIIVKSPVPGKIRFIEGDLAPLIEMDWSAYHLDDLATILDNAINHFRDINDKIPRKRGDTILKFHRGGSHIDLVEDGVGTTHMLKICDIDIPGLDAD